MKRILLFLMMALIPTMLMAQLAGGQIKRKQTNTTATTAKKAQSGTASKKTNSGKRSATLGVPSRRASTGVNQAKKDHIIQNLINNMVYVEGGTFMMGATAEQGSDADIDEMPVHKVKLSSFSIGRYEVTQEEWQAVMGSNPSDFKGPKRPVENVSWNDCQEFIRKLNVMTGRRFRLPTEAEWEYSARGGNRSRGYKLAGSDYPNSVAWTTDNSGNQTNEVGCKQPNELGLYDMSGNVWEWCNDWYGSYSSSTQTNPTGPSSGSFRVYRGGSWINYARDCRVSHRNRYTPGQPTYFGFRLAK